MTILIIEDESAIVDNIEYALKTEGFETLWCSTGQEGLEALKSKEITLVLLDVGLPDINGFELFKDLRKESSVPVIFLTARSEEIDRVVGLELGADDYVVKPFSPRELAARVRAVLRRSGNGQAPAHDANVPLAIDLERRQVHYYGEALNLTRYEFNLLSVLMKRPGRIYSREMLMDRAWDEPEASMDRTVDAHIKSLRAKLRAVRDDVDAIITHRGLGYALREDW